MREGISLLEAVIEEWSSATAIPEVDWARMRSLDFQELLRARNGLTRRLENRECLLCGNFDDHVREFLVSAWCERANSLVSQYSTMHAEKVLRSNIANLKLAISDQNLELIPDYEQRIAVLQDLKFIDEYSTVLLKGRVACEVRRGLHCSICSYQFRIDQLCK